ncbi:glycine betaine ABC transporter substrate-binding protein [Paracoccus yeei]|uniref:glycine betaine ABC transporter substrate-binding protein n=1 Tax=Paracoccus yeei TaxID=147645 RepID=UPI0009DE047B|nr:glycine betaine ABC transporter substrate-binding protein [Paracoccus yeei]OWJ92633.1 hypothetical protein CDV54_13435 [Paracoccus yeei]
MINQNRKLKCADFLLPSSRQCCPPSPVGADAGPIKLGSKAFTENILVAEITKQYLEAKGFEADLRSGLGSTVIREAIVSRQIDLY